MEATGNSAPDYRPPDGKARPRPEPNPAPTCDHCGEIKQWHQDARKALGGYWRCAERRRATQRRQYDRTVGVAYNRLLLRHRRNKAMHRQRNREVA